MRDDNPMYKCIRCQSKEINPWYKIKYGLHNWHLCVDCSREFFDLVVDGAAHGLKNILGVNMGLRMNNFTKEELQEMLGATITLSVFYKPDLMNSIRNKILSMIDNYCDHHDDKNCYTRMPICTKCDKPK